MISILCWAAQKNLLSACLYVNDTFVSNRKKLFQLLRPIRLREVRILRSLKVFPFITDDCWQFVILSRCLQSFGLITFHKLITDQFVTNLKMATTHFSPSWLPKAGSCWRPRITLRRSWRGRRRRRRERPEGGRLIPCMNTHSHSFQR